MGSWSGSVRPRGGSHGISSLGTQEAHHHGIPNALSLRLMVESGNLTLGAGFPTSIFSGQNPDSTVVRGTWGSEGVGSNSESPRFWPRFQIPGFLEEFGSLVVTDGVGYLGVQSLVVTVSGGPVPKTLC